MRRVLPPGRLKPYLIKRQIQPIHWRRHGEKEWSRAWWSIVNDSPYLDAMLKQYCRENYQTALWLILGSFVVSFISFPPLNGKITFFLKFGLFTSCIWVFLWLGNAYTSDLVTQRISWTERPVKRFAAGMVVMVVYTITVVVLLVSLFRLVINFDIADMLGMIYGSLIVTFIISLFMHSRGFLQNWKQAAIDAERAKQESVKAQYESLRSQVNPHFLFNSLNALTNLVYENQDKAAAFIKQLSEVYRYVLDTRDKELVPLADELKFLDAYLFLQKIRFGEKLRVAIQLEGQAGQIPPLALQLLLENAIKHNVIAEESPLVIRLFAKPGYLCVTNNIQKRAILSGEGSGIGLENIRRRYAFLSDRPVVVDGANGQFTVMIPLIADFK